MNPDEIKTSMLKVLDDCKKTPPEKMREELIAAGWKKKTEFIWSDPNGKLFLGPYGAWKRMKAAQEQETSDQNLNRWSC